MEIWNKQLHINGELVSEPFIKTSSQPIHDGSKRSRDNFGPLTIGPGTCFVMGENRDNSYDSRFFGPIKMDKIKGRAEVIYFSRDETANSIRFERIGMAIE